MVPVHEVKAIQTRLQDAVDIDTEQGVTSYLDLWGAPFDTTEIRQRIKEQL